MTDRISTDELRKLLAEATPGKWTRAHIHEREFPNHTHLYSKLGREENGVMRIKTIAHFPKRGTPEQTTADADLITASRDLAAEVIRLREALSEIWLRHIPDQPAAYGWSERDWVVSQHTELRRIARAALNHKETDEEMRTCHHCKKQTAKRQLSCTWCGIWEKG